MTVKGPRLTAILLCALLALLVCLMVFSCDTANREMRAIRAPVLVTAPADPPPLASMVAPPPPARFESSDLRTSAGPSISPTAAPGVAFNYRYAFLVPAARIAGLQEHHAQLCERLTAARCRITGMLYRAHDDRPIEARLELKLDPRMARHFGRSGVDAMIRAEGRLIESEISGADVGGQILSAGRSLAELEGELEGIERQLRGAIPVGRPQLEYQAQQLRERIRALRDSRETQQEALATTPMLFQYASGIPAAGAAEPLTLQQASGRALGNFLGGVNLLLIVLVTLLPWALAALFVWTLARVVRRRWFPARPAATAAPGN